MERDACREELRSFSGEDEDLVEFWQDLEKVYALFEKERKLPPVKIDAGGRYVVNGQ